MEKDNVDELLYKAEMAAAVVIIVSSKIKPKSAINGAR